jgi:hypothetical protein
VHSAGARRRILCHGWRGIAGRRQKSGSTTLFRKLDALPAMGCLAKNPSHRWREGKPRLGGFVLEVQLVGNGQLSWDDGAGAGQHAAV